jgi:hypothetical protein
MKPVACVTGEAMKQRSAASSPSAAATARSPKSSVLWVCTTPLGCDSVPEVNSTAAASSASPATAPRQRRGGQRFVEVDADLARALADDQRQRRDAVFAAQPVQGFGVVGAAKTRRHHDRLRAAARQAMRQVLPPVGGRGRVQHRAEAPRGQHDPPRPRSGWAGAA